MHRFGWAHRSVCFSKESLDSGSSYSFWAQNVSCLPLLKSQNWELLYFHGGRGTITERDPSAGMSVFWPTPRTCFWPHLVCQTHNPKKDGIPLCVPLKQTLDHSKMKWSPTHWAHLKGASPVAIHVLVKWWSVCVTAKGIPLLLS